MRTPHYAWKYLASVCFCLAGCIKMQLKLPSTFNSQALKKMSGVQFVPAVKDYFKNSLKERS